MSELKSPASMSSMWQMASFAEGMASSKKRMSLAVLSAHAGFALGLMMWPLSSSYLPITFIAP